MVAAAPQNRGAGFQSEMDGGGLGWPWGLEQGCEAVQLPPCFSQYFPSKKKFKKDIGWNKKQNNMEQDLKYPVYVLREI